MKTFYCNKHKTVITLIFSSTKDSCWTSNKALHLFSYEDHQRCHQEFEGWGGFARAVNGAMICTALEPTQVKHKIQATSNVSFYSLYRFADRFIN